MLLGTIAFSLIATLVFGAGPALALTGRAAAADLKRHTGDEGRRRRGDRIGNALVIGQIALSLLLLASGGLFLMSVIRAATADPGFRLDGGLIVEVDPALAGYDEARGRQAHRALIDRLRTVPGVEAVTIGSRPPFTSGASRDVAPAVTADARSRSVGAAFSVVGAGQFLQGILYGVNRIEPVVLVTAPLILLAASLLASYVPALRATRVDPTVALRSE